VIRSDSPNSLRPFPIDGSDHVKDISYEEGTSAAWLHDLLKPHVSQLLVCDPRKAALLKEGNKSDRIDARKLAELLRTNQLKPVYHGEHGIRTLKELGRSYLTVTKDLTRTMSRIKSLYRSPFPPWRTRGWLQRPRVKLYEEFGLVNLSALIPSLGSYSRPRVSS